MIIMYEFVLALIFWSRMFPQNQVAHVKFFSLFGINFVAVLKFFIVIKITKQRYFCPALWLAHAHQTRWCRHIELCWRSFLPTMWARSGVYLCWCLGWWWRLCLIEELVLSSGSLETSDSLSPPEATCGITVEMLQVHSEVTSVWGGEMTRVEWCPWIVIVCVIKAALRPSAVFSRLIFSQIRSNPSSSA